MRRLCSVRCGYTPTIYSISDLLKSRMNRCSWHLHYYIFSSGENGVGNGNPNPATQKCLSNDGRNVTKFITTFPASYVLIFVNIVNVLTPKNRCPLWIPNSLRGSLSSNIQVLPSVTTVRGSTNIPDVAVTEFFSGGGFSNYVSCRWLQGLANQKINHYQFPRPAYQAADADAYLNALPKRTYAGLF